ncbi:MAG TPA: ring-opening amidohydrolase [Devosia sp.]|jgi:cyanuric acid amidohydrolase|uniref:ring-opening amidohydrolase n=1 Tax=Devosia sp. TaxID=1871048 RepID=UPI002DDD0BC0|nr:ring-opening amidohydrolase [Devosia sp.]HEV2517174.1 ring-opening amidohydrolase [Devosia sp.]
MTQNELVPAIDAFRLPLDHTSDVAGLKRLMAEGRLHADDVIAVTGKTEGWRAGETSRLDADQAIRRFLLDYGSRPAGIIDQLPMVFTTGGIGILTPHIVVYARALAAPSSDSASRLAMGVARSDLIRPEWMTTTRIVEVNADAVRRAAANAGIDPRAVEYVVGKAYYPSKQDFADARAAGHRIPDLDDGALFRKASGAAGLGVAVAADGMQMPLAEEVSKRLDLWSAKVAVSANEWEPVGGAGPQTQLMAFGNRAGASGRLRVGHAAMVDTLDVEALHRALRRAGLDVGPGPLSPEHRVRVVAVYVKFSMPVEDRLRGRRQIAENPEYGNQVKAALGGMFSAILQDNLVWISGSATHQGPAGGGTVAAIVDVS